MGRISWLMCGALFAAGVTVITLANDDTRLVSISRTHGPSVVEAFGVALLLAAWLLLLAGIWTRRAHLPRDGRFVALSGMLLIVGLGLTAWSVLGDHGLWWLLGAALLAGPQLLAAAAVSGTSRGGS